MSVLIGAKRHRIFLQNPGDPAPDGDGGFVPTWIDLVPAVMSAGISAPEASDLERVRAHTLVSAATKRLDVSYHPQVTTKTRIIFNGAILSVVGVTDPDELHARLVLMCVEVVP